MFCFSVTESSFCFFKRVLVGGSWLKYEEGCKFVIVGEVINNC